MGKREVTTQRRAAILGNMSKKVRGNTAIQLMRQTQERGSVSRVLRWTRARRIAGHAVCLARLQIWNADVHLVVGQQSGNATGRSDGMIASVRRPSVDDHVERRSVQRRRRMWKHSVYIILRLIHLGSVRDFDRRSQA